MNYCFSIKFKVFYYPITKEDLQIRKKLCEYFHVIFKTIADESNNTYKYLNRIEPTISSLDEKKQLRMELGSMFNNDKTELYYIEFNQKHSCCIEYFNLEELKFLSHRIMKELDENFFHQHDYTQDPIIYIHANEI